MKNTLTLLTLTLTLTLLTFTGVRANEYETTKSTYTSPINKLVVVALYKRTHPSFKIKYVKLINNQWKIKGYKWTSNNITYRFGCVLNKKPAKLLKCK